MTLTFAAPMLVGEASALYAIAFDERHTLLFAPSAGECSWASCRCSLPGCCVSTPRRKT
jgi:hypothetical protein